MKLRLLDNPWGLCLVSLRIKGEIHTALIDTGASRTSIIPSLVPAITKKYISNPIKMSGIGGIVNHELINCQFNFVGVSIPRIIVNTCIAKQGIDVGLHYSILVGQDLLRQYRRITIDYVEKTIEFVA